MPRQTTPRTVGKSRIAKLMQPRLRGAVPRERLFRILDQALEEKPACCCVAPPGSGKTTLVASWLESRSRPCVWVQVDSGDTDLATFFYYLGLAVQPFLRKGMRALPHLTPEYQSDVPAFSRRYFREMFKCLPEGALVVLDNYQEVASESLFHEIIAQAIQEVPRGFGIVIVSRRDPPDCYVRLIANEHVAFLVWEALQLTLAEAMVIAGSRGNVDDHWVRQAHASTEGWAAGLILMLERRHAEGPVFAPDLGHERVFAYFADQVLSRLPEDVRDFLLIVSILPSVSARIAQVLTQNSRAQEILDDLYRRQLFVHRRPGDPPTFQFHALFREFLLARAQTSLEASAWRDARSRAAVLLSEDGNFVDAFALHHSLAEWDLAIHLVIRWAPRLLASGRGGTVQDWIRSIPECRQAHAPWLWYWLGRAQLSVNPALSKTDFQRAHEVFGANADVVGQVMTLSAIMETHWLQWIDFPALDDLIEETLDLLAFRPKFPESRMELRAHTILLVALSHRRPGSPAIAQVQQHVMNLMETEVDDVERLLAAIILVGHALPPFDLALARWAEAQVGELVERSFVTTLMRINWSIRLACHYTHRGEYKHAATLMDQSQRLAESENLSVGLINRCWWGGFVSLHAGDLPAARRYSDLLHNNTNIRHEFKSGVVDNIRCMVALSEGQSALAAEHGRNATRIAFDGGPAWSVAYFAIPTIFALIDSDADDEAIAIIRRLRNYIAGTFIGVLETELLLAEAYLFAKRPGLQSGFRDMLARAMSFAREHQYIFGFRTLFKAHRVLLSSALEIGVEEEFVRKSITLFNMQPGSEAGTAWPWEVKVFTLGRFEILRQGTPMKFGRKTPRRVLALLKCIIAFGAMNVAAHKLVDALWPDEDGATASHAFRIALHRLRKMLGSIDSILMVDGLVSLNRRWIWDDVMEFDRTVGAQRRGAGSAAAGRGVAGSAFAQSGGLNAGGPYDDGVTGSGTGSGRNDPGDSRNASRIRLLQTIYRGEFLPQEADASWPIQCRRRLAATFEAVAGESARP